MAAAMTVRPAVYVPTSTTSTSTSNASSSTQPDLPPSNVTSAEDEEPWVSEVRVETQKRMEEMRQEMYKQAEEEFQSAMHRLSGRDDDQRERQRRIHTLALKRIDKMLEDEGKSFFEKEKAVRLWSQAGDVSQSVAFPEEVVREQEMLWNAVAKQSRGGESSPDDTRHPPSPFVERAMRGSSMSRTSSPFVTPHRGPAPIPALWVPPRNDASLDHPNRLRQRSFSNQAGTSDEPSPSYSRRPNGHASGYGSVSTSPYSTRRTTEEAGNSSSPPYSGVSRRSVEEAPVRPVGQPSSSSFSSSGSRRSVPDEHSGPTTPSYGYSSRRPTVADDYVAANTSGGSSSSGQWTHISELTEEPEDASDDGEDEEGDEDADEEDEGDFDMLIGDAFVSESMMSSRPAKPFVATPVIEPTPISIPTARSTSKPRSSSTSSHGTSSVTHKLWKPSLESMKPPSFSRTSTQPGTTGTSPTKADQSGASTPVGAKPGTGVHRSSISKSEAPINLKLDRDVKREDPWQQYAHISRVVKPLAPLMTPTPAARTLETTNADRSSKERFSYDSDLESAIALSLKEQQQQQQKIWVPAEKQRPVPESPHPRVSGLANQKSDGHSPSQVRKASEISQVLDTLQHRTPQPETSARSILSSYSPTPTARTATPPPHANTHPHAPEPVHPIPYTPLSRFPTEEITFQNRKKLSKPPAATRSGITAQFERHPTPITQYSSGSGSFNSLSIQREDSRSSEDDRIGLAAYDLGGIDIPAPEPTSFLPVPVPETEIGIRERERTPYSCSPVRTVLDSTKQEPPSRVISESSAVAAAASKEIEERKEELRRKEAELARFAQDLKRREEAIAEKEELRKREEELRRLDNLLKQRQEAVARKEAEEKRKQEEQIRQEAERRMDEERRAAEMERHEEELRKKEEEEERKREEARLKEELRKKAEELRRKDEERSQQERERIRLMEEELKRKDDELKRQARLEELRKKQLQLRLEEERKKEELKKYEERMKQEEEERLQRMVEEELKRRKEEERRLEEKRLEDERRAEEERRREERRLEELRRREELRRIEEEERRKEEQRIVDEERRKEEQRRLDEHKRKEEQRRIDEERRKEEQRKVDEERRKEERRRWEEAEKRKEADRRKEEQRRREEDDRRREERLVEEEQHRENERRREEERHQQQQEDMRRKGEEIFIRQQEERWKQFEEAKKRDLLKRDDDVRRAKKPESSASAYAANNAHPGSPASFTSLPGRNGSTTSFASASSYGGGNRTSSASDWSTSSSNSRASNYAHRTTSSSKPPPPPSESATPKPAAGGWRTSGATPTSGASSSTPPSESEWQKRQEEHSRKQQEQFRREAQRHEQEKTNKAAQTASRDSMNRAWDKYESGWQSMKDVSPLRFRSIPWPVLTVPVNTEELTTNAIGAFVLSPHHSQDKPPRERLKEQLLRWHPDRFEGKWLSKVAVEEKEAVRRGVGQVVRGLNELMARENSPFA